MYDVLIVRIRQLQHWFKPTGGDFDPYVTLGEAADAIEELSVIRDEQKAQIIAMAAEDKPRWIPVTERLPEHGQEVLCACKAGIYEVFKYVDGISGPWYKDSRHVYMKGFVTHWTPLPEPPKEE